MLSLRRQTPFQKCKLILHIVVQGILFFKPAKYHMNFIKWKNASAVVKSSWKKKGEKEGYPWWCSFALAWPNHRWASVFFFQYHKRSMVVDYWWLSIKTCQLFREFKSFTTKAKVMAISWLVKWHSFSYQLGTKELQKHPTESCEFCILFCAGCQANTHWLKQAQWLDPKYGLNSNPIFSPWEMEFR